MESNTKQNKNWKDIDINFTEELQKEWEKWGFNYEECKEWIDIGLTVNDADYAEWLRDVKEVDGDWVLNEGNDKDLRQEFTDSRLSEDVIVQIENFKNYRLTSEQKSLLEKLIPNQELRKRYEKHGLCYECNQPNTEGDSWGGWCRSCNARHLVQEFLNWTSGNLDIDKFIQSRQLKATSYLQMLEWISYEQFTNIEHIETGGFSKIYKAKWKTGYITQWGTHAPRSWDKEWKRCSKNTIILKSLNNSQNISVNLLKEITYNKMINCEKKRSESGDNCYGISQDPKTKDYIMVMKYFQHGSLRNYLTSDELEPDYVRGYRRLLVAKLEQLESLALELSFIHGLGLVHRDLHSGNILGYEKRFLHIADLGLCRPVNESDEEKIYGVLPYMAPEILQGQPYTQASDIYSLGMIMYEIMLGLSPYYEYSHDRALACRICDGLRPQFKIEIPQSVKNLIEKCWDADPNKRPTASYLYESLSKGDKFNSGKIAGDYLKAYEKIEEYNKKLAKHPQAIYTSRLLDFGNLPQPQNSQEINDQFWNSAQYTQSIEINSLEIDANDINLGNTSSINSKMSINETTEKNQQTDSESHDSIDFVEFNYLASIIEDSNTTDKEAEQEAQIQIPPKK